MALPSSNLSQNILPMDWDEEYSSDILPMDWDEELSSNVLPMDWDEKPEEPGWVETITEAVTEDVPASFKVSGGGLMQQLATPGGLASEYPGLMQAPSLLLDIAKEKWGKPIVDAGKELATTGRKEQQEGISPYTTGSPKYYTRKIVSGAAEMLPSIAAGIITRNPNLSLAMMGTHAGASKYDQSIREGRSHDQATTDGIFFGLSEALTEKIPLGILMKRGGGYFVNIGKAGAAEAIQEPVNELIQQLYDTAVLDKEMTFDEVVHNMGEAAKIGGGVGVLLSAITGLFIRRGGSLVDLDDTTLETKPGELDLDETQPIVGPPGPATTVTGPPSPTTPVDLELAEEGAPVVEAVDVPTISTGAETRLDAIEEPIIDTPVVDETVIDEEVPRKALGDADPISQPGFYNRFQDMISRIVLGGENPRKQYQDMVQQVALSLGEGPDAFFENNKELALLSEGEQDQSLIIAEDGARLPVSEIITSEGKPARSTRIDIVAALRRGNEIFNENFENFIYEIQRYHQSYGTGRPPLKTVIDLGGGGMDAAAYYNPARHELVVNLAHLMSGIEGAPKKDLSATAIHELVHMKVWTLFQDKALQALQKSRKGETITPDMIDEETHSLVDNFGRKLVKPLQTEIKEFLNARWARAKEVNYNPAKFVAESLNLQNDANLFNRISNAKDTNEIFNILSESMESGERLTHTGTEGIINLPVGVGFHLIHELLAYNGMTLDTLLDPGSVPTPKQKTFIQKFLRLAKQILGQVLGNKQLTKEDISDFINVMFLETAGAMEKGTTEQTRLYKAAQEQAQPTPLKGESYDIKPPISRMADEKIDLGRRKFLKQTAGAVAGAAVDPTILAEPAAAAAAVTKRAPWAGMAAIDTVYRFAESIMVQDEAREEGFEGEIVYDIVYDSSKPNELEVNVTIGQDDVETYVLDDIKGEEGLEPGEQVTLEMHDVDKIVSDMITTGRDPSGSETEWNTKNIHTVMPPHRDPFSMELADEDRGMNEQDLELYTDADLRYLENVSGEEVRTLDGVGSKSAPGPRTDLEVAMEITRDRATGEIRSLDREMEPTPRAEPTAPAKETTKVIDQIGKLVTENTEALKVLKEAIGVERDLAKPVEGEVIPAKRKREPGMAEEETIQELRDILAGSEERLERLQDVGRDEDIETIEEYEAEIKEYEKDIKGLKEEIKEIQDTMPRKEGEKPPIVSRMVETEPGTLNEKIENIRKGNFDENMKVELEDGTFITAGEMIDKVLEAKKRAGTGRKRVTAVFPREWLIAFSNLYFDPEYVASGRDVGKDFLDDINTFAKNADVRYVGSKRDGQIIKLNDVSNIYYHRDTILGNKGNRNINWKGNPPIVPKNISGYQGRVSFTYTSILDEFVENIKRDGFEETYTNLENLGSRSTKLRNINNLFKYLDTLRERFKFDKKTPYDLKKNATNEEKAAWFVENKDKVFTYKENQKNKTSTTFIELIKKENKYRGSKAVSGRAYKERVEESTIGAAIAFSKFLQYNNYTDIPVEWRTAITEKIYKDFKEKGELTEKEIENFVIDNFEFMVKPINKDRQRTALKSKGFEGLDKVAKVIEYIMWEEYKDTDQAQVEHAMYLRKADDKGKSLGINHPIAMLILPGSINMAIGKENALKLPEFVDFITAYNEFIDKNADKYENNATELMIDAYFAGYNEIKDTALHERYKRKDDKRKQKRLEEGKKLKEELTGEEVKLEYVKGAPTFYKNQEELFEQQKEFMKEYENAFADITNEKGNWSDSFNPMISRMVEPVPKEYEREAGWHQTGWNTFASFMWSKPVETIRRYRYASPTMAKLADMIQRDISETKRVIKGGLDYIQRKGMALGQFRVALQAVLDNMTGRTGVMSKAVNDAVALYLIQGTPIKDPKVAKAAEEMKQILESIYVWSTELGSKITKDFSLRPLDGGLLPRVWNIEELATANGRKKFMKLLASIGIVDNLESDNEFEQTAATDAYNIALNSGGFISGDFTTTAYNQKSKKRRKFQVELFEKIEKEVSRAKLGTLLVNDIQAALPRFVDKAIEKTLYAELFGHYDEALWEMKAEIEKEIREYNQKESTKRPVKSERAMRDIDDMMAIIRHRFKMDSAWFHTRRYVQWFTNFTTVTLMPFVSLASMPEFFTPLMLGSKNPVGFVNDFRSVSWYAALRAMNGMSKLFRGKQLDAMLYPKGKAARRAMFLKALGIIDIKSQGEAAAMRYIGPSFIRTGIAAQGPGAKLGIKALYKLYGLGDAATGRFRARKVRSLMNMDTYFELVLLTSLTQMQQQMAANNLRRYTISLLKSISKGKGNTLQDMKILKDFGLTREEINEAVRWYKAGHREFYDVPAEFKWDPSGMTLRFVDQVITRPNEATAAKAFRHPGMAPLLIFKSFMTTFGNTFMVAMRDRVRFAEGEGTAKTRQQAKMVAGYLATIGAMYGMVIFAQSIRHMLQYDDDDDDYMDDVPEWKKFVAILNRTGLLTAPGSQLVDIFLPFKYGWWQTPSKRTQDVILGPAVGQGEEILDLIGDLINKGEVDLEKFLARIAPITKYEMFRDMVGAPSYYEKD